MILVSISEFCVLSLLIILYMILSKTKTPLIESRGVFVFPMLALPTYKMIKQEGELYCLEKLLFYPVAFVVLLVFPVNTASSSLIYDILFLFFSPPCFLLRCDLVQLFRLWLQYINLYKSVS